MQAGPNPLDQLADVTLGDDITWWPLAWGWWAIIALVLVVTAISIGLFLAHRKRTKIKRDALQELQQLDLSAGDADGNMHAILKNAVLKYYPLHNVARLSGEPWRAFLTEQMMAKNKNVTQTADQVTADIFRLEQSLYTADVNDTADSAVLEQTRANITTWIKASMPPKDDGKENQNV